MKDLSIILLSCTYQKIQLLIFMPFVSLCLQRSIPQASGGLSHAAALRVVAAPRGDSGAASFWATWLPKAPAVLQEATIFLVKRWLKDKKSQFLDGFRCLRVIEQLWLLLFHALVSGRKGRAHFSPDVFHIFLATLSEKPPTVQVKAENVAEGTLTARTAALCTLALQKMATVGAGQRFGSQAGAYGQQRFFRAGCQKVQTSSSLGHIYFTILHLVGQHSI